MLFVNRINCGPRWLGLKVDGILWRIEGSPLLEKSYIQPAVSIDGLDGITNQKRKKKN